MRFPKKPQFLNSKAPTEGWSTTGGKVQKTFHSQFTTSSTSPNSLLPTQQIIKLAQGAGVDFGTGDPAERIRYFIKLGILPHMVRKVPAKDGSASGGNYQTTQPASPAKRGELPNYPTTQSVGHLPTGSVKTLVEVESLKRSGLSY